MVVVVLVLALFGLWTPVAVALVIALQWDARRRMNQRGEAARHRRLACAVCGAHEFTTLETRTGAGWPSAGASSEEPRHPPGV